MKKVRLRTAGRRGDATRPASRQRPPLAFQTPRGGADTSSVDTGVVLTVGASRRTVARMELTATLFDTGERIGPATDLHLKSRAANAGLYRPGLIFVDDVIDV